MNQQTADILRAETEHLWLIAVEACRAAAVKQREYKAALLERTEAIEKERANERQRGD